MTDTAVEARPAGPTGRRPLIASPAVRWAVIAVAVRVLVIGVGFILFALQRPLPVEDHGRIALDRSAFAGALDQLNGADSGWYRRIALTGYDHGPVDRLFPANWPFFPGWPILLRVMHWFGIDPKVGGPILATLLLGAATYFLHRLLSDRFDDRVAARACLLFVAFPGAYFGARSGPEALFSLLGFLALYAAVRQGRWWLAVASAAGAAASRMQGALLAPALALSWWRSARPLHLRSVLTFLSLGLIPLVTLLYLAYAGHLAHDPLAVFHAEEAWDHRLAFPYAFLVGWVKSPMLVDYHGWDLAIVSMPAAILVGYLTVRCVLDRRVPRDIVAYVALTVLLTVARNNAGGTLRYLLPVAPLVFLPWILHWSERRFTVLIGAMACLQVALVIAFWHPYYWAMT